MLSDIEGVVTYKPCQCKMSHYVVPIVAGLLLQSYVVIVINGNQGYKLKLSEGHDDEQMQF